LCISWWIKNFDNIKMHSTNVKKMFHDVSNDVTPHKGAATKQSLVWQKLWSCYHVDWPNYILKCGFNIQTISQWLVLLYVIMIPLTVILD
jgi:hypothetical protein